MSRLSFRQRLTLFSTAGIALVLLAGSITIYVAVRSQLREQIDESLHRQSGAVVIRTIEDDSSFEAQRETSQQPRQETGDSTTTPRALSVQVVPPQPEFGNAPSFFQLIDAQGEAVAPGFARFSLPISEQAIEVARTGTGAYYTDVNVNETELRMYVSPVGSGRALLAARSLSEVDHALSRLGWSLAITCLVGSALAAVVGAVVARGALRPVRTLTATAERITDTHDLSERIQAEGDDELGRLGSTFNAMLDSLEGAIRSQRQLVSDASHELRTPLTSLRTNIDLLRQGITLDERDRQRLLRDVSRELQELTTLVGNIVELARGSQRDLHLERVRLDELAERVVQRADARFPLLQFELGTDETTVWGDSEELERAIWNLVENAAKWSDSGSRIDVRIIGGEVTVRDYGPGVSEADRPFVFDRFYRSETARSQPGSGLGLAIVRQIADSHGGRVEVESAPGGGARFRLTFVEAADPEDAVRPEATA
jgi:two-component system sensor histidine kinase MprB